MSAVLVGGVDTTQAELAHGLRLFAADPDQWRLLRDDPELAAAATEEVLRFEPITRLTARITREEIVYRDVVFPEGTIVLAASVTANRDPAGWQAPIGSTSRRIATAQSRSRSARARTSAGRQSRAGRAPGGVRVPRRPDAELELDGDPVYDTPLGVYGLHALPIAW